MLILTRKIGEEINVGNEITIKVLRIHGNQVSIGIAAPATIAVHRREVYERIQSENSVPLKIVEVQQSL